MCLNLSTQSTQYAYRLLSSFGKSLVQVFGAVTSQTHLEPAQQSLDLAASLLAVVTHRSAQACKRSAQGDRNRRVSPDPVARRRYCERRPRAAHVQVLMSLRNSSVGSGSTILAVRNHA